MSVGRFVLAVVLRAISNHGEDEGAVTTLSLTGNAFLARGLHPAEENGSMDTCFVLRAFWCSCVSFSTILGWITSSYAKTMTVQSILGKLEGGKQGRTFTHQGQSNVRRLGYDHPRLESRCRCPGAAACRRMHSLPVSPLLDRRLLPSPLDSIAGCPPLVHRSWFSFR